MLKGFSVTDPVQWQQQRAISLLSPLITQHSTVAGYIQFHPGPESPIFSQVRRYPASPKVNTLYHMQSQDHVIFLKPSSLPFDEC